MKKKVEIKSYSLSEAASLPDVSILQEWKEGPETAKVFVVHRESGRTVRFSPCGNIECKVSTGIHEGPTFGSGELDKNGFWEKPCSVCARARERMYPNIDECWPFK